MEQLSIEAGNRIIAEFNDLVLHTDDPEYGEVFYHKADKFKISRYPIHELKYNLSWDWIMPIVEKIEGLGFEFVSISRFFGKNPIHHKTYIQERIGTEIANAEDDEKINSVYQCVIQFIQWYQTQNTQP